MEEASLAAGTDGPAGARGLVGYHLRKTQPQRRKKTPLDKKELHARPHALKRAHRHTHTHTHTHRKWKGENEVSKLEDPDG